MNGTASSIKSKPIIIGLLAFILVVAAGLRFYNLLWDQGTFPHPDERSTLLFYAPTIHFPDNLSDALDPRQSPLNPFWEVNRQQRRSYTYGHFPLYLLVLSTDTLQQLAPTFEALSLPDAWVEWLTRVKSGQGYAVVGRWWMALFDLLSVYLVFLIARRLYGNWAGLLAAALTALAPFHVQLAHFFAVDPISTTFVLLTIYGSICMYDQRRTTTAVWTGIGVGLAVAAKFSALPIVLAPAMAVWLMLRNDQAATSAADEATGIETKTGLHPVALLALTALISFLTFALTSPFVLLDFENFRIAVLDEQGAMVSGMADFPFTRQYRNTTAYLYFIEQQVRWGLGWPLGLLAFAGLLWAMGKALIGRAPPPTWIILAWVIPYFGLTGLFLAKFMRYMSPVTPFAIIFGVGLLVAIYRWRGLIGQIIGGLVLLSTVLWSLAFFNGVYGSEHSWVTASRWIYDNVPDGSCIAVEHWEEGVPRDVGWLDPNLSPGRHAYRQPQMPMYDPDTADKFYTLRDTLRDCDYLVIASNRMSRTLPNLPERYPLSSAYYQALFAEQLGYDLVATFETPPRLGPLTFDDQAADESFTVYDHPKAYIFQRAPDFSEEQWWELLGDTWQPAIHNYIGPATLLMKLRGGGDVPTLNNTQPDLESTALTHPLGEWPVVDDWRWNLAANGNWLVATLWWWLVVLLIGVAAFPITWRLLGRLSDGGYLLSRSLGLLLLSYGVWLPASFGLPVNRGWFAALVLVILTALSLWAVRGGWNELRATLRGKWVFILSGEVVFAAVYLLFIWFRLQNPDLWQPWNGGEKMLEIGFLHAIVKSATMPPYDPFFAGTYINYYYYGLFIVGVLIKLTGITPVIAFNLATPLLAALTALNAFVLAGSLVWPAAQRTTVSVPARLVAGALAVISISFLSNLDGMGQFLRNLAAISGSDFESGFPGVTTLVRGAIGFGQALQGTTVATYNFWDPSRVIPETINEFPYWSFLFADLHPHMIGIPFTMLLLALVYKQTAAVSETAAVLSRLLNWLAVAFVLGALAVINTWDLPTYLGIAVAAFAIIQYRRLPATANRWSLAWLGLQLLFFAGALTGVVLLLYQPFFQHYQATDVGLGLIKDKIPLDQFLKLWGLFFAVIFVWLWQSLRYPQTRFAPLRTISIYLRRWNVFPHLTAVQQRVVTQATSVYHSGVIIFAVTLGVTAALVVFKFYSIAAVLPWLVIAFYLLLRRETSSAQAFTELLIFTGLLLLLGVQFVFLKDFLGGGSYYRMNTYFKFFVQVWILFGLALAVLLPRLWDQQRGWHWGWKLAWQTMVVILFFASSVYAVLGTPVRLDNRFPGARPTQASLNGIDYMTVGQFSWDDVTYDLRHDHDAINWLVENVPGTPVIAEAMVGYYREGGMRVAAYTGLPSVLGGLHQSEQHFPAELGERDMLVRQFWFPFDDDQTRRLIDQLGIEYIYLGQIERALYGPTVTDTFARLAAEGVLEIAYENPKTVIYRVAE